MEAVASPNLQPVVPVASQPPELPTIWGLDPVQLHARFWAAQGVQVVRQGEPSEIVSHAELFLLTDPRSLVLFKLSRVLEALTWIEPQVMFIRLHDTRERGYRERVVTDQHGRFVRFQRLYNVVDPRLARVALTPEREIAQLWQSAADPLSGWRRLRKFIYRGERLTMSTEGNVYERENRAELGAFMQDLVQSWNRPDVTVTRAARLDGVGWRDPAASIEPGARIVAPVWVGAGRKLDSTTAVIGPAVIWDDPASRPPSEAIQWLNLEPTSLPEEAASANVPPLGRAFKRLFDIVFSIIALVLTCWVYPLVMLAIWIEDGRPFLFTHRRETLGGREFPCIKFRSMRKDAHTLKAQLAKENIADGPQFAIPPEKDVRLTRVGKIIRKLDIDELPQFINVLLGHMSIVGPRPSPYSENQFCPAWREARLSVRPGVTGLWQIKRTRRAGSDFQEWIKYDLEYVEKMSVWLDLKIVWATIVLILRKASRA